MKTADGKYLPFQGTNWHQNMMLVWSVITQMNNSSRCTNSQGIFNEFWQHLTSYMSDIHIRGGNYTKAVRPAKMPTKYPTRIATEDTDPSSENVYDINNVGNYECNNKNAPKNMPKNIGCKNILTS